MDDLIGLPRCSLCNLPFTPAELNLKTWTIKRIKDYKLAGFTVYGLSFPQWVSVEAWKLDDVFTVETKLCKTCVDKVKTADDLLFQKRKARNTYLRNIALFIAYISFLSLLFTFMLIQDFLPFVFPYIVVTLLLFLSSIVAVFFVKNPAKTDSILEIHSSCVKNEFEQQSGMLWTSLSGFPSRTMDAMFLYPNGHSEIEQQKLDGEWDIVIATAKQTGGRKRESVYPLEFLMHHLNEKGYPSINDFLMKTEADILCE